MKIVRITLLTGLLLVSASTRPISTTAPAKPDVSVKGQGDCILVNGIWICE